VPRRESHETERAAPPAGALQIDHSLRLSGELTEATIGGFETAIRGALQSPPREIVVDLTEVGLVDEAGLTALLKAHLRSRRHGSPIKFVPAEHPAVRQVVAVTGTEEASD
jgi:anti-anti-sigma regulatory factor